MSVDYADRSGAQVILERALRHAGGDPAKFHRVAPGRRRSLGAGPSEGGPLPALGAVGALSCDFCQDSKTIHRNGGSTVIIPINYDEMLEWPRGAFPCRAILDRRAPDDRKVEDVEVCRPQIECAQPPAASPFFSHKVVQRQSLGASVRRRPGSSWRVTWSQARPLALSLALLSAAPLLLVPLLAEATRSSSGATGHRENSCLSTASRRKLEPRCRRMHLCADMQTLRLLPGGPGRGGPTLPGESGGDDGAG